MLPLRTHPFRTARDRANVKTAIGSSGVSGIRASTGEGVLT